MDNQFFTPNVEDLKIGDEIVSNLEKSGLGSGRIPIRISSMNIEHIAKNISWYEVPFLSKEQIEAEGWLKQDNSLNETQRCGWIPDYELPTDYGSLRLYISYIANISKEIIIERYDRGGDDLWSMSRKTIVFRGQCKDINTLRYITKLI